MLLEGHVDVSARFPKIITSNVLHHPYNLERLGGASALTRVDARLDCDMATHRTRAGPVPAHQSLADNGYGGRTLGVAPRKLAPRHQTCAHCTEVSGCNYVKRCRWLLPRWRRGLTFRLEKDIGATTFRSN